MEQGEPRGRTTAQCRHHRTRLPGPGRLLLALAAAVLLTTAPATAQNGGRDVPANLLADLQDGGYVIYFRHTVAVAGARPGAMQALPVEFEDCVAPERLLDPEGVQQAQVIGRAFADLAIPTESVLSSPYCRCIETAWYAFGPPLVQQKLAGLWGDVPQQTQQERVNWLRNALGQLPPPGTNRVLVAHLSNLDAAAQLNLAQGEAAVFRPEGGDYTLVARLMPRQWRMLGNEE